MWNEVLLAVPLFIFMGVMLERSKVAEELLESMGRLFGRLRGGLGISVLIVGALLAASTGIVGATVVTMGLLSLPTMLRRGYDPKLASGMICASGNERKVYRGRSRGIEFWHWQVTPNVRSGSKGDENATSKLCLLSAAKRTFISLNWNLRFRCPLTTQQRT